MHLVDLPWGTWKIVCGEKGVSVILPTEPPCIADPTALELEVAEQLREYARGQRREFTVPVMPEGTDFQKTVWQALLQIPYGTSVTYGQIAKQIGRPKAVRAVARAIGANPCLVLIPCHRVLGSHGSLTGFSAGLELKRKLLALERILWKE